MKKKILLAISAITVLIIISIALVVHFSLPVYKNTNSALIATENALSSPNTLVLASIDVNYLKKLHAKLYGTAQLADLLPEPAQNSSVYTVIQQALMQQHDSISYITASIYSRDDNSIATVLVAGGNFQPDSLINSLKSSPHAQPHESIKNAWTIQTQNVDTCQMSSKITLIFNQHSIIAMDSNDTGLLARLEGTAPATRDLNLWQNFRKSRFLALAIFPPKEMNNQSINPFIGMAAQQATKKISDIKEIYLGAAAKTFPPSGSLSLWMNAQNQAIAGEKASAWQAELVASRTSWEKSLPTLAAIHDHATVINRDKLIQADIKLDKKLASDLSKLPAEFIGLLFSGFSMNINATQKSMTPPTETIDTNPRKFTEQVNSASLAPYDPKATFAESADFLAGPFGIQLAGVRLTDSQPRLLELDIKAMAKDLPNISDKADSALALSVNSVRDKNGKELMQSEPCGSDRNLLAAHPKFSMGSIISAVKNIRLHEQAHHTDVTSIQGNVKLNIPTRIEYVSMPAPKASDYLEREGLRIEVTQTEANSVSYRTSGKREKLLHLRARNAKGEYLSSNSSFSMDSLLSDGKSTTTEFRGNIASLEFVLANAIESKVYPFELKDAYPRGKSDWLQHKPAVYEVYNKQEIKREFAQQVTTPRRYQQPVISKRIGPALLDLDRSSAFRNMQFSFSVYLPPLKSLTGTLAAAELEVHKFSLADGKVQYPENGATTWHALVPLSRNGSENYVSGQALVETGIPVKDNNFSSISGKLWLNLPLAIESKTIALANVGAQIETACGPLQITEISHKAVAVEGAGDPACLYAVRALNSEGKELLINNNTKKTIQQGWRLELTLLSLPSSLELIMMKKSERVGYPFVLNVTEGNPVK